MKKAILFYQYPTIYFCRCDIKATQNIDENHDVVDVNSEEMRQKAKNSCY